MKSPVNATRPNAVRSRSGYDTGLKSRPSSATDGCAADNNDRSGKSVDKPAVTGPDSEGALIVQGRAADGRRKGRGGILRGETRVICRDIKVSQQSQSNVVLNLASNKEDWKNRKKDIVDANDDEESKRIVGRITKIR